MSAENVAATLVGLAGVYVAVGLVFGVAFVTRGVVRIDPGAHGASLGFRLVVLPGVVALWPLLASRWYGGSRTPPVEHNAHRSAARAAGEVR